MSGSIAVGRRGVALQMAYNLAQQALDGIHPIVQGVDLLGIARIGLVLEVLDHRMIHRFPRELFGQWIQHQLHVRARWPRP